VGLIRVLASTERKEEAQALLSQAKQKIPADKAPAALAPCYEILGKSEQAAEQYQQILATSQSDPRALRRVAEFCLRAKKLDEAETHLQQIISSSKASAEDVSWARRAWALVLEGRGGYANLLKAVDLLDQNIAAASTPEDRRLKATILSSFPQRAKRREAIELLEGLVQAKTAETASIQFALASSYLRERNWEQASSHMRALLANHAKEPRFIASYVSMLLNRDEKEAPEAETWLRRLEEIAPQDPTTIALLAEWRIRRQLAGLAIAGLSAYRDQPSVDASERDVRILRVIAILKAGIKAAGKINHEATRAQLLAEMDNLVKDYVARHPEYACLNASLRLQQGKVDEALAIAGETWPKTELKALLGEIPDWLVSTLSQQQLEKLDRILKSASEKHGNPITVLQLLENLRMRFRPQYVAEIESEILKQQPRNVVALNNLALVMALQGKSVDESLALVNRAIEIAGPVASFLDTRAVVLIVADKPKDALTDLEEVLREDPKPSTHFHRALAYLRLGQKQEATEAFHDALRLGLKPNEVFDLEKPEYEELVKSLAR
jgi:cellulose synthase operon protein C